MNELPRILFTLGFIFFVLGGLLLLLNRIPGFGKMPGDIIIKRENFSVYVPLMSCIIISLLLSAVMFFINRK